MQQNRKQRKASGVYKLEALFHDPDKKTLTVGEENYCIDGRLGEYSIVSVPETTTQASAADLEYKLNELAKKPVIVVTHNIAFIKATLLTGKEQAELGKIVDKASD